MSNITADDVKDYLKRSGKLAGEISLESSSLSREEKYLQNNEKEWGFLV